MVSPTAGFRSIFGWGLAPRPGGIHTWSRSGVLSFLGDTKKLVYTMGNVWVDLRDAGSTPSRVGDEALHR